jgi:molybdopterin-synthase adenylyltransferase
VSHAAALDTATYQELHSHLLREDGQEDLCFALWHPSSAPNRTTALLSKPILPLEGERHVHGNASFESSYLHRAAVLAGEQDAGLALLHSHPGGRGWQGMSADDIAAEHDHTPKALALTGRPLLGLTIAGDGALSARLWQRTAPRTYAREDCEVVRVSGDELRLTFNSQLLPPPAEPGESQQRTVSAWGRGLQADLARMRVAIVGAGSVGTIVAEVLARTGIGELVLIDFDSVETVNLDRLLFATPRDVQLARSKVEVLAHALTRSATNPSFKVHALEASVVEPAGFRAVAGCDLAFSCVDRPWARHALNYLASAHLIPLVDGGIAVAAKNERLRHAQWRAHMVAPGRRCLRCLGQYDLGLVDLERRGDLENPTYIAGLPEDHVLRARENVIAFSSAVASMEVLQFLTAMIAPSGLANPGAQTYQFVRARLESAISGCDPDCPFDTTLRAQGDDARFDVTGTHEAAERERAARAKRQRRPATRLHRWLDRHGPTARG